MDIITIFQMFPDQESCINHLEAKRWNSHPTCPYCGSNKSTPRKKENRHQCHSCNRSYSVLVGTIFEDTNLPLQKWFLAISLILNAKKGISSRQLARDLKVSKDTAWYLQMRLREAMKDNLDLLSGIVEIDETYIGGKPRKENRRDDDQNNKRGRGTLKTPVVGMVERDGKVKAKVQENHELKFKDLKQIVKENINLDQSTLIADEYKAYNPFQKIAKILRINHKIAFANGEIHTNTIEGFWALIKRGIIGQYHKVSIKYLEKYITEFCFKYNFRKLDCAFDLLIGRAIS